MRKLKILLFVFFCSLTLHSYAALVPGVDPATAKPKISYKQMEKFTGNKMTFVQRLMFRAYGKRLEKLAAKKKPKNPESMGTVSMLLGIGSIILLLLAITGVPFVFLTAIFAAIGAILLGSSSQKGGRNGKGIAGIIMGGVTLLLVIVGIVIAIAALSGFTFE